jgi:hypothetical protein
MDQAGTHGRGVELAWEAAAVPGGGSWQMAEKKQPKYNRHENSTMPLVSFFVVCFPFVLVFQIFL